MNKKIITVAVALVSLSCSVHGAEVLLKQKKKDSSSKGSPKKKPAGQAAVPSLDLKNSDVRKTIKTSGGSSSGGTPKTPVKDVGELLSHVQTNRTKTSITGQSGEGSSPKK